MALSLFTQIVAFMFIDYLMIIAIGLPCLLLFSTLELIKKPKERDGDTIRVILIHGSGSSSWQWIIVRKYLDYYSIPHKTVNYDSKQKIRDSCEQVIEQFDPEEIDGKNICLIGHSLGGLIAKIIACEYMKQQPNILFMINTPQRGAIIINWLEPYPRLEECVTNELRFGSDFIKNTIDIAKNVNLTKETEIHEIVGKYDFIRPEHSQMYEKNVYMSYSGHYFSMVNPYLWFKYMIPKIESCSLKKILVSYANMDCDKRLK